MTGVLAWCAFGVLAGLFAAPFPQISWKARSIRPGELVVLTVSTAAPASSLRVRAFDRECAAFAVNPRTWRVLIGIDLDVAPATYELTLEIESPGAPTRMTYPLAVKPRTFRTRTLTVAEAFVTPPPEMAGRIEQEAALVDALYRTSAPVRLWHDAFVPPVAEQANSAFGTRSIFNGQLRRPHGGADFPSAEGTPIKAPNAGRVVLARELYFTGNTVIVDHGLGLFSLLAHLSSIGVKEGDTIETGDIVGAVGATGRVTGPHLHWGVRAGDARVDPLSLLAVLGEPAAAKHGRSQDHRRD
jgi:murein DD-endopeptidase MepM/ murein hydrolase activator NlpD